MQTDFWLERWEQNQIGFHEKETNSHLQTFWGKLNLPTGSKVFVPLCGKSNDLLWFLAQNYQVYAVELSPLAVECFFSENQLEAQVSEEGDFKRWEINGLTIFQGNFFNLKSDHLPDCCALYDRASLIALPVNMRKQYSQHVSKIVPALNHTLLVTLEYDENEMQGPPFSVQEKEVRHLFAKNSRIECLYSEDILEKNEQFKQKGLTQLNEKVFWICEH